ncbi:MAG: peptidase inhibitor [Bacteroidia bacterium]|nr:MAG: peptidase inhibitor [Bacteroidia bacterium]
MKASLWFPLFFCLSPALFAQTEELRVVVRSPQGMTATIDQAQQIVATFNQPMVPLRELPEDESTGPLMIDPPIAGKYRWMGTFTLAFIPDKPLPFSTSYKVTIPAGTRSLPGQSLHEPIQWTFETPRPRMVSTTPYRGQQYVELNHSITVTFNQPVDPGTVSSFISIEERRGQTVTYPKYVASRPEGPRIRYPERSILLTPREPFGKGSQVTVRLKAGLQGTEGPLGMLKDEAVTFSTYNEFTCLGVGNSPEFPPSHSLHLRFSNPVSQREVARHLSFAPPLPIEGEAFYDYHDANAYFSLPFRPEQQYTLTILEGLKDMFGNEMTGQRVFTFKTGSYPPSVRMVTGQGILEAYESHKYPVTFTNVDSVILQMARIPAEKIVEVMRRLDYSYYQRLAWEEAILQWVSSVGEDPSLFSVNRVWKPVLKRNEPTIRPVDLDEVLGEAGTGVVLLQVQNEFFPPEGRRYLKSLIQVTHMGITAKFSPNDNLIWVTMLKNASPIHGATVELRNDSNTVLWSGTTDKDGFVKTPGWGKLGMESAGDDEEYYFFRTAPRLWVIVRHKGDVAFSSSDWTEGIEPYTFSVPYEWNPKVEPVEGSVFSDRGLYKAGEQVHLKAVVRIRKDGTWSVPPTAFPLKLIVRDARNEEIHIEEPRLSPFGTFAATISLKPDAPLGYYSVSLHTKQKRKGKDEWIHLTSGSFRVEAFRPAEFEVTARFNEAEYILGDNISGTVSGRYLFGGAMKRQPVTWRMTANPTSWNPPGYEGYFFGRLGFLSPYAGRNNIVATATDTLDNEGFAVVKGSLTVGEFEGPQSLQIEADVTSQARQVISGRASVLVHGGEWYIGVRPAKTFVQTDSVMSFDIVSVTPEGKPVSGQKLSLQIVQRYWRSVRVAETGGRYRWESSRVDTVLQRATIETGGAPIVHSFRPSEAGFYFVSVEGRDSRGNRISSDAYFYVSGNGYVAWERGNDDRIELVSDKSHYKPGETAGIIVKSPYEQATALVSIEREGILRHYRTTLVGSAPRIDIPIRNEYLPNVFVSVVLLQGRVDSAVITREADVGRPSFKIGYVALGVSPREKLLDMSVAAQKQEYRPGDTVEVRISVRTQEGKRVKAEVALSVADLGVLNLIGYRLPKLFDQFYRPRGLAVTTSETRIHLIEQRSYDEKGEDEGGGGAEMMKLTAIAEGARGDFRPNAYWNPSIVTDAHGEAVVRFKLPDNLTSFEIMAVANTLESEFGYAESMFRVNKPLLLQASLPRFVRVGDEFEGGVVILNYTEDEKNVELVTASTGIGFGGRDTVRYTLKPGEAREVRYPLKAERTGTGRFVFRARTDTDEDGLIWNIPIQIPRLRESVALYETLADGSARQKLAVPDSVYSDLGAIEFTLASTGIVGLSGGISYLFGYPYGCLEQRLSRVLPMILAEDLVKTFKFEVLKDKDYKTVVTQMIEEIPLFQKSDGGFAYWKNTDETWPYLSAFTMYTLVRAQQAGYAVSEKTLEAGFQYLRKVLAREVRWPWASPYYWDCTDALSLYTLAIAGRPDHGYMQRLSARKDSLPLFAKAYLLKALHSAGSSASMVAELSRELTNMAKVSQTSAHFEERDDFGASWCWSSNARTTALLLQTFVETQPENSLIPKMVRWLVDQQKVGRWRTTQENLYVVDALATYIRVYEKEEPAFTAEVKLAGGLLMKEMFRGRTFDTRQRSIALSELVLGADYPIDIAKTGPGRLYYTIRMNYYPKGESRAKEEGFSITKSVEPVEGAPAADGSFRAGSVARVKLTISTNQERNFVVVDDPVPAGFEIINTSLLTSGTNLRREERSEGDWWSNPFRHRESYDDRALFFADYLPANVYTLTYLVRATSYGTFNMPSTRIEGMYEPEVFGQTGSRNVRIR